MKNSWKVDIPKLISLVSLRLYSNSIKAGLRELITNSLDAKIDKVEIEINYDDINKNLYYSDNGIGIDPDSFSNVYGKIASGHKRRKGSRGFFGIGRMSLIASSREGAILSFSNGKVYTWKFNKEGWEGPEVKEDLDKIGHGIYLEFKGLDIENLGEIERWIKKTFSIPIDKGECQIRFQMVELHSIIDNNFKETSVNTKYGSLRFYYKEETDGTLFVCQKGILVREEPYTGLTAFIDQTFLDIKTDREGFVNNEKYRYFKKIIHKKLSKLRPIKSFEKMEIDFIKRLMKDFKRYWVKKTKTNHVMENLKIEFPEKGKEIIEPTSQIEELEQEGLSTEEAEMPEIKEEIVGSGEIEVGKEEAQPLISEGARRTYEGTEEAKEGEQKIVEEQKVVKIKGAKPVDMGEDYPAIFFERDPFILIFNTSHPLFLGFIGRQKLGRQELSLLLERMLESAYLDKKGTEDLEEIKERWKDVDSKLKKIFKKD